MAVICETCCNLFTTYIYLFLTKGHDICLMSKCVDMYCCCWVVSRIVKTLTGAQTTLSCGDYRRDKRSMFFFFQMTRQTQRHIVIQNTHGAYFKKIMRLSLRCPCGLCYHITPSSTTPSLGERAFSCSIALQRPWTVTQEFIQSVINPLVSVILPPSLRTEFVQGIATRLRLLLFSWFSGRIG